MTEEVQPSAVEDPQPTPKQNVEQHPLNDQQSDQGAPQSNQASRPRNLPPHLRERWIVSKDPPKPTMMPPAQYTMSPAQYTMSPVQYNPMMYPTQYVYNGQTGLVQPLVNNISPITIQSYFPSYPNYQQYQPNTGASYSNTLPQTYSGHSTSPS